MENFRIAIPEYIKSIISALSRAGFDAYVVGGSVRDALLGKTANDWDVCTSAKPLDVKNALSGFEVIETGIAHGTVTAISDGKICEITTFRCESEYTDHRHPDAVSFTSDITEDLKRRDFTVNAMAYSEKEGLIDLFGGKEDLDAKIIRCVGNPCERFSEDALRVMRALRFAATLNFSIDTETEKAIGEQFPLLSYVANERITAELKRLLCGSSAADIIKRYKNVFDFILDTDISVLPEEISFLPKDVSLRTALLLKDKNSQYANEILRNLKFDNATISSVVFLIENKNTSLIFEENDAKRKLSDFGKEKLSLLSDFILLDKSNDYKSFIEPLPVITLAELKVNGNDLIKLGIPAGKKIREILTELLSAVIDGRCDNERNSLLSFLKKHI